MHPGAQDALQGSLITNTSRSNITIESVSLTGRGIGTVVRLVGLWMAPVYMPPRATPAGTS
jgi:hypothetical protein